jgi:hypothetical protein
MISKGVLHKNTGMGTTHCLEALSTIEDFHKSLPFLYRPYRPRTDTVGGSYRMLRAHTFLCMRDCKLSVYTYCLYMEEISGELLT